MHQHTNSVALVFQLLPSRTKELRHLRGELKKKYNTAWDQWTRLQWDARMEHLRKLSFSSLGAAARFFDDIYGPGCFSQAWGAEARKRLDSKYREYQELRNGILHRGGELASGVNIDCTEADIDRTFGDAKEFRDAILKLSTWCRSWWLARL